MRGGFWKRLIALEELPDGRVVRLTIGRKEFLVARRGTRVDVCGNICPHYGAALSGGLLAGAEVVCPRHGARFSVEDGAVTGPPALDDIPCYQVRVEDGVVHVGAPRPPAAPWPPPELKKARSRERRTFLIVGAGAAGNACAEALRRLGFPGKILMLGAEPDLPCNRPELSKGLLAGTTPAEALSLRGSEYYQALGIGILTGHRVQRLDLRARLALCANGRRFRYDRLLLASGGEPRALGVPGEQLHGCFRLRSRADGLALAAAAASARRAVLVGAGFIGLEAASALRARGVEVEVVAPEPLPLEGALGPAVARRLLLLHRRRGVRFLLGRTVVEILGAEQVRSVRLSDGSLLEAELVLVAVGIEPAVAYLEGTGLTRKGVVPVDGNLHTAAMDVFAAGDLAAVPDRGGTRVRVEHWASAERQGQHAAAGMLGRRRRFLDAPFFWTEQYGLCLQYVGLPGAGPEQVFRHGGQADQGEEPFLLGYYRAGRLVAAAGLGHERELMAVREALLAGRSLPPRVFADPAKELMVPPPGRRPGRSTPAGATDP